MMIVDDQVNEQHAGYRSTEGPALSAKARSSSVYFHVVSRLFECVASAISTKALQVRARHDIFLLHHILTSSCSSASFVQTTPISSPVDSLVCPTQPPAKPDISYCSRSDPVVLCTLRRLLHVRCARVVRPTVARRQLHLLLPSRKAVPPRLSMQVVLRTLLPSGPRWQGQHPPHPRPLVLQRHPHSLLRLPRQSPDPFRFPMLDGPGPMIRTMICPAPLPLLIAHRIRQLSARRNG